MQTIKKTDLLAVELEVIADTLQSNYCREVLKKSAERLRDLEWIAEFYRTEAERLIVVNRRKEKCKGT